MDNIQKSIDYMRQKSSDIKDKVCFLNRNSDVYKITMEVADYYDNAVSALIRNIPKKPKNIKMFDERISHAECPNCGIEFPDIGGIAEAYMEVEQHDFCPDCGQKIDWNTED